MRNPSERTTSSSVSCWLNTVARSWTVLPTVFQRLSNTERIIALFVMSVYLSATCGLLVRGMVYLQSFPLVGDQLVNRIVYLHLFLCQMVAASLDTIIGFRFLRPALAPKENASSQARAHRLGTISAYDAIHITSAGVGFASVPILLSYGIIRSFGVAYYLDVFFFSSIFLCIPTSLAVAILPLYMRRLYRWVILATGLCSVAGAVACGIHFGHDLASTNYNNTEMADEFLRLTGFVEHRFLPSSWIGDVTVNDVTTSITLSRILILMSAAVGVAISQRVVRHSPYSIRATCNFVADLKVSPTRETILLSPCQLMPGVRFMLPVGLSLLYVFVLYILPTPQPTAYWIIVIDYLNFGICSLILTILIVRFVYPKVCLTAARLRELDAARFQYKNLFTRQVWISWFIISAFIVSIVVSSGLALGRESETIVFFMVATALMSVTLGGLTLGVASFWADLGVFESKKVASSFGDVLCLLLSLVYIVPFIVVLSFPRVATILAGKSFLFSMSPKVNLLASALIALLLSAVTVSIPLAVAMKRLKRRGGSALIS